MKDRLPLIIKLSHDEEGFLAWCLEMDLIGDGDTIEEVMKQLLGAIETQIEVCDKTGAQLYFTPEETLFWFIWQIYERMSIRKKELTPREKKLWLAMTDYIVGFEDEHCTMFNEEKEQVIEELFDELDLEEE